MSSNNSRLVICCQIKAWWKYSQGVIIFPSSEASRCSVCEVVRDSVILSDAQAQLKLYSWSAEYVILKDE